MRSGTQFGRQGPVGLPERPRAGVITVIAITVLGFLIGFSGEAGGLLPLAVDVNSTLRPWTLFTHIFISPYSILGTFFLAYWTWMTGVELERDLGTPKYLLAAGTFAIIGGLSWLVMSQIAPGGLLTGTGLMVGALTVAWCMRNPEREICFFALRIKLKWVALAVALLDIFSFGYGQPLLGLAALPPLAAGWAFAADKLAGLPYARVAPQKAKREEQHRFTEFNENVRQRRKRREENERLRKMFEDSLNDD